MSSFFYGIRLEREALPEALTQPRRDTWRQISWNEFVDYEPPRRGGAVGTWSATESDPLAEVLVVRDEDYSETLTWLNAYFAGLSPITQWCRVLPYSVAQQLSARSSRVTLGKNLGLWVGAILAECSVQAGGAQNLKELPGSAALSTATFAAGRAAAIWSEAADFKLVAKRHDDLLAAISREVARPLSADKLLPLWRVLAGDMHSIPPQERNAFQPLHALLSTVSEAQIENDPGIAVQQAAYEARNYFDLPQLSACAEGPQVMRVRALDRLGERLADGPMSPVLDALLGMGASFIDPGSAVAPELLRRYTQRFPVAPLWQGVFAGAFSPFRVMTDQGGLGRLIGKSLLANDDLVGRPTCDIAFEELVRWITPGRPLRLDVRGISSRALEVELFPGVTCSFATSRPANSTSTTSVKGEIRPDAQRQRTASGSISDVELTLRTLQQRVSRLESQLLSDQPSLELPDPKDTRSRKSTRSYSSKKS